MANDQNYQQQQYPQQQYPQQQYPQQQYPQYPQQQYPQYPQQQYQAGQQPPMKPDNNMVWAILSTVLCCNPIGIVSIVYASKVDGLYNSGDYAGAQSAAKNAMTWAIVTMISGLVIDIALTFIFLLPLMLLPLGL